MAAKRTRQTTVVTFGVTFELPRGFSMENARKYLLNHVFNQLPDADRFPLNTASIKVKVLERHVRYTERGTITPDGA